MARRVSLKGKGADLFFEDRPPGIDATPADDELEPPGLDQGRREPVEVAGDATPSPVEEPVDSAGADLGQAAALVSTDLARDERTVTPMHGYHAPEGDEPGPNEQTDAEFFDSMWARLASKASISHSFRYTAPELEEMADVLYEVSKEARARVTKQDIARLGLNVVLWDHRRRGAASWMSEFARRKRQPQEG